MFPLARADIRGKRLPCHELNDKSRRVWRRCCAIRNCCCVAEAATGARTLYTGFLLPEQSPECGAQIARSYAVLEGALRANGRALRVANVFSPSSGTVCRSRLYHLSAEIRVAAS